VLSSWTSNETARRGSSTPNGDDLTKKKRKKKKLTKTKTNKHEYLFFVLHFETSKIRLAETIQDVVAAHSESQATQGYSHNIFSFLFRFRTHLQHLQRNHRQQEQQRRVKELSRASEDARPER
jgi:C4-type Zn-finger protein